LLPPTTDKIAQAGLDPAISQASKERNEDASVLALLG
jgi:hypothetical protein